MNRESILKSDYLSKYREQMKTSIHRINKQWDLNKVDDIIISEIEKSIQNPKVKMNNNYINEEKDASLIGVFDWTFKQKPIIAGNGTFYKNQHEAPNPIARMLKGMLMNRKAIKKEMFKYDEDTLEYKDKDREQKNEKINCNSYYGGSGLKTSAFYSTWSGPATTLSAQQIISTTENTFEAFVADNYNFFDLNELFDWLCNIDFMIELDAFMYDHPISKKKLKERILSHIIHYEEDNEEIIDEFVDNLTEKERIILYYKNNLIQFVDDHPEIIQIYRVIMKNIHNYKIIDNLGKQKAVPLSDEMKEHIRSFECNPDDFKTANEWNTFVNREYFMDPNNLPHSVQSEIKEFADYAMKYVFVPYMPFDRVYRLKNFKRKTVTVIDTDSNILALDTWVNYTLNTIMESDYGRDRLNNIFIIVNTITYMITMVAERILNLYGIYANIPEDYRPELNMKNEFFFIKLVIGKTKKRYLSKVMLREGNLMSNPKTDVKGFDFVKSHTSPESEKFYRKIIDKYIMGDKIDPVGLRNELQKYVNTIRKSIEDGDVTYLSLASVKDIDAYVDPGAEQSIRGSIVWNTLYPDDEIDIPSKPKLLKLAIYSESDLDKIKESFPYEYETLKKLVFEDTSGMFVVTKKKRLPNGDTTVTRKDRGCTSLCIPPNRRIPEWCKPFINYDMMIDNILSPFKSVTDILGIQNIVIGKTINQSPRTSEKITNIIKF